MPQPRVNARAARDFDYSRESSRHGGTSRGVHYSSRKSVDSYRPQPAPPSGPRASREAHYDSRSHNSVKKRTLNRDSRDAVYENEQRENAAKRARHYEERTSASSVRGVTQLRGQPIRTEPAIHPDRLALLNGDNFNQTGYRSERAQSPVDRRRFERSRRTPSPVDRRRFERAQRTPSPLYRQRFEQYQRSPSPEYYPRFEQTQSRDASPFPGDTHMKGTSVRSATPDFMEIDSSSIPPSSPPYSLRLDSPTTPFESSPHPFDIRLHFDPVTEKPLLDLIDYYRRAEKDKASLHEVAPEPTTMFRSPLNDGFGVPSQPRTDISVHPSRLREAPEPTTMFRSPLNDAFGVPSQPRTDNSVHPSRANLSWSDQAKMLNASYKSTSEAFVAPTTAVATPPQNPFGTSSNTFDPPSQPVSGLFALPPGNTTSVSYNPFRKDTNSGSMASVAATPTTFQPTVSNPFGGAAVVNETNRSASNPFGGAAATNGVDVSTSSTTPSYLAQKTSRLFGAPSGSDVVDAAPQQSSRLFSTSGNGDSNRFKSSSTRKKSNPFAPSSSTTTGVFGAPSVDPFASITKPSPKPSEKPGSRRPNHTTPTNGNASKPSTNRKSTAPVTVQPSRNRETSESLDGKIQAVLARGRVRGPEWPTVDAKENPAAWEAFTKAYREYRNKSRLVLTQAGLIDDPEVPKKLEDAIVFKGTCEDMCPELETAERIVERRYDQLEKEYLGNGTFSAGPVPELMVKKLARSAAGQEAPLPNEVRTVKALRNTLDYLIDNVLANVELPSAHGFIWDRTRAIRRDLVFHSYFTDEEMLDRVYILENITRFHVVALHLMSEPGVNAGDFVEQQEHEQLGKTLTSLIHAYEDCQVRRIECENEEEFRAYNLLFNRRDEDALTKAQTLDWKFWGLSEVYQIAVELVEAYQSVWDSHGPLKNPAATSGYTEFDVTLSAFSKFFTIVQDSSVSYIMACFAEICFNDVRKSIIKCILKSYRRQKDQTKDWTLSKLNTYLRFDDEAEIVPWGEKHGLHFESGEEEEYLSISESAVRDAWPASPQQFSYELVESKRGDYELPTLIHLTVFGDENEEDDVASVEGEEEDNLFVKDNSTTGARFAEPSAMPEEQEESVVSQETNTAAPTTPNGSTPPEQTTSKPMSLFDRIGPLKATSPDSSVPAKEPEAAVQPKPLFSFLSQSSPTSVSAGNPTAVTTTPKASVPRTQHSDTPPAPVQPMSEQIPLPTVSNAASTTPPAPKPLSNTTPYTPTATINTMPAIPASTTPATAGPSMVGAPSVAPTATAKTKILGVAEWVFSGEGGLMDQFVDHSVGTILLDVAAKYFADVQNAADAAANDQARIEADQFRYRSLATRYVHNWREAARKLGLKRRGRETRKFKKELMASKRAEKIAEKENLVEEFRASTTAKRRQSREEHESVERLLEDTGVLGGVHDPEQKLRAIVQEEIRAVMNESSSKKRRRYEQSTTPTNGHKHNRTDDPLRRSLLSDPTYLNGQSRIHLMSNYDDRDEHRRQKSGVQSDYWRLKARGIVTLPNGVPLASSAAKDVVHQKRSFDGITKSKAQHSKVQAWTRGVPAKAPVEEDDDEVLMDGVESDAEDKKLKQKSLWSEEEEALFARRKRLCEKMDEGAEWYREYMKLFLKSKSRSSSS